MTLTQESELDYKEKCESLSFELREAKENCDSLLTQYQESKNRFERAFIESQNAAKEDYDTLLADYTVIIVTILIVTVNCFIGSKAEI